MEAAPSVVSVPHPDAIPPRLSAHFTPPLPSRPIHLHLHLACLSLQEASWARAPKLFTPIHRLLILAILAANSNKNKQIFHLTKSLQLRDQLLLSMQGKLDNLSEQVHFFKDESTKNPEFLFDESSYYKKNAGCADCRPPSNAYNSDDKIPRPTTNDAQPEERCMSDLSDWAPSVASSIDFQLNSISTEQDIYNLRKECEEKDATIKELSTFFHSSEVFGSKRIAELEDVVRRKNMIITKLKKDMVVLEQKVMHLTRLGRPFCKSSTSSSVRQFPIMADNLVYDMDSATSPSSSDSDSSPFAKSCRDLSVKSSDREKSDSVVSFSSSICATGDFNNRRRAPLKSKHPLPQKKWA